MRAGGVFMRLFYLVQKEKRGQKGKQECKRVVSSYHRCFLFLPPVPRVQKFGGETENRCKLSTRIIAVFPSFVSHKREGQKV